MVGYERLTGTRWKLRPRLFGLPEGIRRNSLFPGEGNHIPRSTVMVNEHSLWPLTEPLPPATPFRCAAGPWVHLRLVLRPNFSRRRNYRANSCYPMDRGERERSLSASCFQLRFPTVSPSPPDPLINFLG